MPVLGIDLARHLGIELGVNLAGAAVVPPTLEAQVRAFAFSNLRADTYTVDLGTGKVAGFTERSTNPLGIISITPSHALVQAVSALQCAIPAPSGLFAGALVATFVDQRYQSNSPAASWSFQHDGGGYTAYNVFAKDTAVGTQYLLTTAYAAVSRGVAMGTVGTTAALYVGNGTAAMVNTNGGTVNVGVATYTRSRYAEGVTPEADVYVRTSAAASQTATTAAPSSSAPEGSLMLGNRVVVLDAPFVGKWAETIILRGAYDPAQDATVRAYLAAQYGLSTAAIDFETEGPVIMQLLTRPGGIAVWVRAVRVAFLEQELVGPVPPDERTIVYFSSGEDPIEVIEPFADVVALLQPELQINLVVLDAEEGAIAVNPRYLLTVGAHAGGARIILSGGRVFDVAQTVANVLLAIA